MNIKLKEKLQDICTKTETRFSGIEYLLKMYISQGMTEDEAYSYAIGLFENGTVDRIRFFNGKGEEL